MPAQMISWRGSDGRCHDAFDRRYVDAARSLSKEHIVTGLGDHLRRRYHPHHLRKMGRVWPVEPPLDHKCAQPGVHGNFSGACQITAGKSTAF